MKDHEVVRTGAALVGSLEHEQHDGHMPLRVTAPASDTRPKPILVGEPVSVFGELTRRPPTSAAAIVDGKLTPDVRGVFVVGDQTLLAVEREWATINLFLPNPKARAVGHWDRLRAHVAHASPGEIARYEQTGERPVTWTQGDSAPSGRSHG